ncbi:MAG: hypothetical protein KKE16_02635 [Firmicutes bacterium]|nr:hypothetical protein [Bacillota bacterium]
MSKSIMSRLEYKSQNPILVGTISSSKYFNSSQIAEISNRHSLFNGLLKDIRVWQGSYDNGTSNGVPSISHNEIMREMIKIDFDLGGNGLGYNDGTSFMGTNLPESIFNKYVEFGKEPLGSSSLYNVHHINSIHPNTDLATDPNNIVMVLASTHPHDTDGGEGLPKADNIDRIKDSLFKKNTELFFLGLLLTVIYAFVFGFMIRLLTNIVREKIVNKGLLTTFFFKSALKDSLRGGALMMLLSLCLNLITQLFLIFSFRVLNINLGEIGIHFFSIIIYLVLGTIVVGAYSVIKKSTRNQFLKAILKLSVSVLILSIAGLPTLFLVGAWKILGMLITIGILIVVGIYNQPKSKIHGTY